MGVSKSSNGEILAETQGLVLAKNLSAVMEKRNLTFRQLSAMAGVPVSTIADWANGGVPRNLVALRNLSRALNLSFSMMLFGEPEISVPSLSDGFEREPVVDGVYEISVKRLEPKSK